jgi:hypothetical protein
VQFRLAMKNRLCYEVVRWNRDVPTLICHVLASFPTQQAAEVELARLRVDEPLSDGYEYRVREADCPPTQKRKALPDKVGSKMPRR